MSELKQGDIIEIGLNPYAGPEPARTRRAVVFTGYPFNSQSLVVGVVPVQTVDAKHPCHVPIADAGLNGFACIEKMQTMDVEFKGYRKIGVADSETMHKIMGIIRGMLDLQ